MAKHNHPEEIGDDPVGEYDEPQELTDEELEALEQIHRDYGVYELTPEMCRVFGIDPNAPLLGEVPADTRPTCGGTEFLGDTETTSTKGAQPLCQPRTM